MCDQASAMESDSVSDIVDVSPGSFVIQMSRFGGAQEGTDPGKSLLFLFELLFSIQVINFCIKPLSLHHRIHEIAPDWLSKRPLNSLVLQGNFAMQIAHDWLAMCLPEVPSR